VSAGGGDGTGAIRGRPPQQPPCGKEVSPAAVRRARDVVFLCAIRQCTTVLHNHTMGRPMLAVEKPYQTLTGGDRRHDSAEWRPASRSKQGLCPRRDGAYGCGKSTLLVHSGAARTRLRAAKRVLVRREDRMSRAGAETSERICGGRIGFIFSEQSDERVVGHGRSELVLANYASVRPGETARRKVLHRCRQAGCAHRARHRPIRQLSGRSASSRLHCACSRWQARVLGPTSRT